MKERPCPEKDNNRLKVIILNGVINNKILFMCKPIMVKLLEYLSQIYS